MRSEVLFLTLQLIIGFEIPYNKAFKKYFRFNFDVSHWHWLDVILPFVFPLSIMCSALLCQILAAGLLLQGLIRCNHLPLNSFREWHYFLICFHDCNRSKRNHVLCINQIFLFIVFIHVSIFQSLSPYLFIEIPFPANKCKVSQYSID